MAGASVLFRCHHSTAPACPGKPRETQQGRRGHRGAECEKPWKIQDGPRLPKIAKWQSWAALGFPGPFHVFSTQDCQVANSHATNLLYKSAHSAEPRHSARSRTVAPGAQP